MDFDDLVIGSGLAALGTVLGLLARPGGRIGVLCGPRPARLLYYDASRSVPCACLGAGGLGNHWHGVIPTGRGSAFDGADDDQAAALFARFYPRFDLRARLHAPGLFVPWRAIRPARELRRLAARQPRLQLLPAAASRIGFGDRGSWAETDAAHGRLQARRTWLAAGALHTPPLLAPLAPQALRGRVSDHALCYVGQVDGAPPPRPQRSLDGVFLPAAYDPARTALYMVRPAAFGFRRLDHGIEQRAAFGLPTGHLCAKLVRGLSPGLLVEAVYNRSGFGGATRRHSVYAQVPVADAYACAGIDRTDRKDRTGRTDRTEGGASIEVGDGMEAALLPLTPDLAAIRAATDAARACQPFAGLRASRRPEVYLPGIHLHHTLDADALARAGINTAGAPLQVVDASALARIGPDHPSFAVMLAAHERARRAAP